MMYTEIFLGKQEVETNEFGEKEKVITFSPESLFCEEKSVRYSEFYQAMQTGMKAEKQVVMNKYEYKDYMRSALRKFAKIRDSYTDEIIEYTIYREYEKDDDSIELTLTRGVEQNGSS